MVNKMKGKFDKYWGEANLLMAIASVLDPRIKFRLIEMCFPEIYSEVEVRLKINIVCDTLFQILDEYVVMNNVRIGNEASSSGGSLDASTSSGSHSSSSSGWSKLMNYVRQVEVFSSPRSELENYLEDGVYICETSQYDFDVLEWWKINNLKFWFLSKMAADILAIPISIVASESTFSAGGRVIDSYRSSLATNIVQALICGGDRVRIHGVKKIQKAEKKPMEVVLPIS